VGGSEPGAEPREEGMGSSYQAFCIAQRSLQPWPFGAVMATEEEEEGDEGQGEAETEEATGAAADARQEGQRQDQQGGERWPPQ